MLKIEKASTFKTENWPQVVSTISSVFNFTDEQKKKLETNKTAILIASIPFLADCKQAMRTAVAHTAVYHIARAEGKELFLHDLEDDASIQDRLFEGAHFNGGNQQIIQRGMNMIALQMIRGYAKDWSDDIIDNKYNPLVQRSWNFEEQEAALIKEIEAVDCPEMEAVLSLNDVDGIWDAD
jgi:hypothetical protein